MKKITFIISLIGILTLLAIVNLTEPNLTKIDQITKEHINKQVKIQGLSNNIKVYENNFTTFYLNNIQVICNCPYIEQNQILEVIGKVTKYENKLQIEAYRIKKILSGLYLLIIL